MKMYILILVKDGKRHIYAEHGMTRLFDSYEEALKLAVDVYGEPSEALKFESVRLATAPLLPQEKKTSPEWIIENAKYVSVFDDSIACESACKYDPRTRRVYDIKTADNASDADDANARTDEYVEFPGGNKLRAKDGVKFDY